MTVFFNGNLLTTPQTASAVNDDAMLNQNLSVGNVIAYIGQADGGESGKILRFGNPTAAKAALVGGELCDAVTAAFAPSAMTGAAQTVLAIRVNKAFQASYAMPIEPGVGPASGAFGTLKGLRYSPDDLNIKVKVEAGTTSKLRKITLSSGTGANVNTIVGNDVNASRVKIAVKVMNNAVIISDGKITFRTDSDSVDDQADTEILLTQYRSLSDVASFASRVKNKAGNYPFEILFDADSDKLLPSSVLDQGAYSLDTASGFSAPHTWDASWTGYAIADWFNNKTGGLVSFALNDANKAVWSHGPAIADFASLQAAAVVPPSLSDWDAALAILAKERNVQWVHAVSGDEAVHLAVRTHVIACSNQFKERRTICGTGIGVSNADAINRAKAINSDRASLVNIGYYDYDASGKLFLRPAYMTAGLVAAGFAGVNPGTPLTNKTLAVQGLERDLDNPTETDVLIQGGVMPIENTEEGYKITQSISTWLVDSKFNKVEQSCGVAVDYTVANVRKAVDVIRGSKQSPILLSRALSLAEGQLKELSRTEPMGPMVLVGDDNNPAWRNLTGTVEGDVIRIQFEASPAIPNNYVLVTMFARPYSGTATA